MLTISVEKKISLPQKSVPLSRVQPGSLSIITPTDRLPPSIRDNMMEKRQYERFEIELPARMEAFIADKKQVFDFVTSDISASGAFINTNSPLHSGLPIKLTITTRNERIAELTGSQSLIECEGCVVRTTPAGVGIRFNKECQILSLRGFGPDGM